MRFFLIAKMMFFFHVITEAQEHHRNVELHLYRKVCQLVRLSIFKLSLKKGRKERPRDRNIISSIITLLTPFELFLMVEPNQSRKKATQCEICANLFQFELIFVHETFISAIIAQSFHENSIHFVIRCSSQCYGLRQYF